jgi:2-oxoglutarate dehydrogenase E1 component
MDGDSLEGQIGNLDYLEKIYQEYEAGPSKVDPSWVHLFRRIEGEEAHPAGTIEGRETCKEERIVRLAEVYRRHGHLLSNLNPISLEHPEESGEFDLVKLGFQKEENEGLFPTLGLLPVAEASLKSVEEFLKKRYCGTVGFEFKDFVDPTLEQWIQQQIESGYFEKPISKEDKLAILELLTRAEVLETFLHTKHVGKKRFSLEGSESLIPLLEMMIVQGAAEGLEEIYIGMSHRGRINILANILDKPIESILKDFDEDYEPFPSEGMGDIRYHKGHANESVTTFRGKAIKLSVSPNPSHLESICPVVEGMAHAKQFLIGDEAHRSRIMPLLIHGDAALSGQGVVYETLQMGKLSGFETGGTFHLVINNQIGFTTSPKEGRSTFYCTDIAHTFGIPVFHVNAEDPENCVRTALFAFRIRQQFHCDVFIDFNCYRKYGHNEGDEPSFTQPLEYQLIKNKKTIRSLYVDQLVREGIIDQQTAEEQKERGKKNLQDAFALAQKKEGGPQDKKINRSFKPFEAVKTQVDFTTLQEVTAAFSKIPLNFHINPKLEHLIKERARAIQEKKPFDWGMAEFLAYGSLVWEGVPVRLAGQDSGRGTFSHRHALWVDQEDEHPYFPLAHLREGQGRFEVLNTCLSEVAALGFEYGYSTVCTHGLTIWEAQFGDFANSAQVIIDQYLASGEQKWGQTSNLTLFLPHGFEGEGPEHSSARFERYLSLAGQENMQIVNPTTPAQLFHLLRRQVKQPFQKPLIVLTPKKLLRFPESFSTPADLTEGRFFHILDDPMRPQKVRRLILCTGRIYYELDAQRKKEKRNDLAIVRIEQLYPLDLEQLKIILAGYGAAESCQWVQEEPENMGAWTFLSSLLPPLLPSNIPIAYVGRPRSATPATGFYSKHKEELAKIHQQVFQT